ncbi:MAG: NB-ARC domain-containing protein [Pleurocapsa sp.]
MKLAQKIEVNTENCLQTLDTIFAVSDADCALTNTQESVFIRCWNGDSYQKIANSLGYDCDYIKKVGSQLWKSLSEVLGKKVTKSNFQSLLRQYVIEHQLDTVNITKAENIDNSNIAENKTNIDWGEASNVSVFYGRQSELDQLESWIVEEKCSLVAILAMGGMGKTAVSIKLAQQLQSHFDYVVWRTVRDSPLLSELLADIIKCIGKEDSIELAESTTKGLSQLIKYLKQYRCLIVIDNLETVLQPNSSLHIYRNGYEDYGEFIRRMGDVLHQSCIVVTSREKPEEIAALEGDKLPVRMWQLQGLDEVAGSKLLAAKGLKITPKDSKKLIESYQGNALAIKVAATAIKDIFAGDLSKFLAQDTRVFNGLRLHLSRHFDRLSDLETEIMYWLAINRESVSAKELKKDLVNSISSSQILEALEYLKRRSLIERTNSGFTQQPVIMEYVTEKIIDSVVEEIVTENIVLFNRYALIKPQGKDYLKDSQTRVILEPAIAKLIEHLGSQSELEAKLTSILSKLQQCPPKVGYAPGNIINIFSYLKTDITGYNFSHLPVWQADLRNIKLHNCNFTGVDFRHTSLAKTFSAITCVKLSSQGNLLATADTNGEVKIWDINTYQEILNFPAHPVWVWSVAWSPNDRFLATVADDKLVKLWDRKSGKLLKVFAGHELSVVKVSFSPDGEFLASSGQDSVVKIWSIDRPSISSKNLIGHSYRVWGLAFQPICPNYPTKPRIIATGGEDKTIRIWNYITGECLKTLSGHEAWVKSVAFSPDGQLLASGSFDKTIKLWHWHRGECLKTLIGHTDAVSEIAFTTDGKKLISSSFDGTIRLWDIFTGKTLQVLDEHTNKLWSVDLAKDDRLAVSGGDDRTIKLWNINQGKCNKTLQGIADFVLTITVSNDRKFCVSGHESKKIRLWDLNLGKCIHTLEGHRDRIWTVAMANKQGKEIIASGSADSTIKLWDTSTGCCDRTLQGHQSWVWSVDFSPTENILASGSYDKTIKLWNVENGECLQTIEAHQARINCVQFSPEGKKLISSSFDRTIKIWDIVTGECLKTLQGHDDNVWSVVFSPVFPKNPIIASCSQDKTIKLWDIATGNCLKTFSGHQGAVATIAFSKDGQKLISGSYDRTIKIWDIPTETCLKTINGHDNIIMSLTIVDSKIVSGSWDETIKIWDINTGKCLKTLRSPKLYEKMNITAISGVKAAQKKTLQALGAVGAKLSF